MITNKELETHFMRWLKKRRRNLSGQEKSICCAVFLNAIEKGRNYPDRPDRKQRNRKLPPLAGILNALPKHTKAELAEAVAHQMQADFKSLSGTYFNMYLIKEIILKVYAQTADIAGRESESEAAARQWKKTDAPFVALGSLRFNYHFFTGREASDEAEEFRELAEIALLAFESVAKPALLIDKVLSADLGELFRISNLGN